MTEPVSNEARENHVYDISYTRPLRNCRLENMAHFGGMTQVGSGLAQFERILEIAAHVLDNNAVFSAIKEYLFFSLFFLTILALI